MRSTIMWPLQFKTGDSRHVGVDLAAVPQRTVGMSDSSPFHGATLAAIAIRSAPAATRRPREPRSDQGAARLPSTRTRSSAGQPRHAVVGIERRSRFSSQRSDSEAIVDALCTRSRTMAAGAWRSSGTWKRLDGTAIDARSDGYATGLVRSRSNQRAGPRSGFRRQPRSAPGSCAHQDQASGNWFWRRL